MDFKEQLRKQLEFIETSCREYDTGKVDEAVRIATSIRVLFHDTRLSISLLTHLGKKDFVTLLSTAFKTPAFMNITKIEINLETLSGRFVPQLDKAKVRKFVSFKRWWDRDIIYNISEGKFTINRKSLVLNAANQDGGAHVDETLDPFYDYLKQGANSGMEVTKAGRKIKVDFLNAHLAALRQIGYEVVNSPDIHKLYSE